MRRFLYVLAGLIVVALLSFVGFLVSMGMEIRFELVADCMYAILVLGCVIGVVYIMKLLSGSIRRRINREVEERINGMFRP